jgi:hypothetical protein
MGLGAAVLAVYVAVLALLAVSGLHRARLVVARLRAKPPSRPADPVVWPRVTVQLPLFDERFVAERLIAAAGALDYPRDRLSVQVLDDSTDDTTARAAAAVQRLCERGVDAVLIHRTVRRGFKAGALAEGLRVAPGELIAIFDADFVPEPDFLRRTVPFLAADAGIGMVQTRWGHLNADDGWLTRAQATLLDAHFTVEHGARAALGRWFNFNGTAGVWRRDAIATAGGWSADTLTEDLDLSYRAQLGGWRFVYLDDVVAPAELPASIAAFKTQQARWARGSIQTARKLLWQLWRARVPLGTRVEATFHLTANAGWPLGLLVALLLPPAIAIRGRGAPLPVDVVDALLFLAATGSAVAFYSTAIRATTPAGAVGRRLLGIPVALALGAGMSAHQTWAVVLGLVGPTGGFVRTPKQGGTRYAGYRVPVHAVAVVELALAVYLWAATIAALASGSYASVPFVVLFATGFSMVGVASVADTLSHARAASAGTQTSGHSHAGSVQVPAAASKRASTA